MKRYSWVEEGGGRGIWVGMMKREGAEVLDRYDDKRQQGGWEMGL